mmetsp:Transcript_38778/g.116542  ORF Transcript_38778/g.116542 Transcript_38778/m.116542 type:complete len:475 (+) Transcript_38778:1993-3417(+)
MSVLALEPRCRIGDFLGPSLSRAASPLGNPLGVRVGIVLNDLDQLQGTHLRQQRQRKEQTEGARHIVLKMIEIDLGQCDAHGRLWKFSGGFGGGFGGDERRIETLQIGSTSHGRIDAQFEYTIPEAQTIGQGLDLGGGEIAKEGLGGGDALVDGLVGGRVRVFVAAQHEIGHLGLQPGDIARGRARARVDVEGFGREGVLLKDLRVHILEVGAVFSVAAAGKDLAQHGGDHAAPYLHDGIERDGPGPLHGRDDGHDGGPEFTVGTRHFGPVEDGLQGFQVALHVGRVGHVHHDALLVGAADVLHVRHDVIVDVGLADSGALPLRTSHADDVGVQHVPELHPLLAGVIRDLLLDGVGVVEVGDLDVPRDRRRPLLDGAVLLPPQSFGQVGRQHLQEILERHLVNGIVLMIIRVIIVAVVAILGEEAMRIVGGHFETFPTPREDPIGAGHAKGGIFFGQTATAARRRFVFIFRRRR